MQKKAIRAARLEKASRSVNSTRKSKQIRQTRLKINRVRAKPNRVEPSFDHPDMMASKARQVLELFLRKIGLASVCQAALK